MVLHHSQKKKSWRNALLPCRSFTVEECVCTLFAGSYTVCQMLMMLPAEIYSIVIVMQDASLDFFFEKLRSCCHGVRNEVMMVHTA